MIKNQNVERKEQGGRFSDLIKKLGLNQTKTAEIVKTKQASVSHATKGKTRIPPVWLYRLRDLYSNINIDWIMEGTGEMFLSEDTVLEEPRAEYVPSRLTCEEVTTAIARLQLRVMELESRVLELEGRVKGG